MPMPSVPRRPVSLRWMNNRCGILRHLNPRSVVFYHQTHQTNL